MTSIFKFDNTLGAMFIGSALSTTLWGMACVQTYTYYLNNRDDRWQHAFVAFIMALDTLSSFMNTHMCYFYLVENYANPSSLLHRTWTLNFTGLVSSILAFLIRTVFARRIYTFSKNIVLTAWIISLATICLVIGVVLSSKTFSTSDLSDFQRRLLYVAVSFGHLADIFLAASLCWLLNSAKTGFHRNDSLVNILIVYVMQTGLLVTLGGTAGIISLIVMPSNLVFFGILLVISKLYANAYLVSLNARTRLRDTESSLGASLSDPQYA